MQYLIPLVHLFFWQDIWQLEKVEQKGVMTPFETSIFTLTTLIGYFRELAVKQGSVHEMEPLSQDMQP